MSEFLCTLFGTIPGIIVDRSKSNSANSEYRLVGDNGSAIWCGNEIVASVLIGTRGSARRRAVARRIVACVNRLVRFTTEQIEDKGYDLFAEDRPKLFEAEQEIIRLTKQRDELLAALEQARENLACADALASESFHKELAEIDAAIASVKCDPLDDLAKLSEELGGY